MMLLGFCGRAKHGKSTACEAISDYALSTWEMHVGTYEISALVLKHAIEHKRLPHKARRDLTPEELVTLIEVGREQRAVRKSFWIEQLEKQIGEDGPDLALIPNVRYSNEWKWIRSLGGCTVKCTRLNEDGSIYISPDRPANDPSETLADHMVTDHYLTIKNGHGALVEQQAITLFEYLRGISVKGQQ